MTNELNKSSNNDPNPERHFYKTTNPKDDITHILGQQKIDDINKSDTTPDKNAIIELSLTYKQIQENIKDMDNYLDFMRLVIGSPHYAPDITGTIDTNYPIWKKTHNEITQWMGLQKIESGDTIMLPHLQNILQRQKSILREIEEELPKAQKLVKSTKLEFIEHQKIFNALQQTAEYIMLRGYLLKEFSQTDKNNIHPIDRGIFESLRGKADTYRQEADDIQSEICTFLGEWAAIEQPSDKVYNTYKILRRKANTFETETTNVYELMLKYDNQ